MITRIREVRRARGMTLLDVAEACSPPTTAQTIGRLETGTRTVSVNWLNRIAAALGVAAGDLVQLPGHADLPIIAELSHDAAIAPRRDAVATPPVPAPSMVAVVVTGTVGDYRTGDTLWCDRVAPDGFAHLLNRDVLLPRPAGRFIFGRLIGREGNLLHVLPPGPGGRQQVISDPAWAAVPRTLLRSL